MKKVPQKIDQMIDVIRFGFLGKLRIGKLNVPAHTHSIRLMLMMQAYGYDPEVFLGAGGHDLYEDTLITPEYIRPIFGERVDLLISACTLNPKFDELTKGEDELHKRVLHISKSGDLDPLRIKVGDSFDNHRTSSELKPELQRAMLRRGKAWLIMATRFIKDEEMVCDFRAKLEREEVRIKFM